MKTKAYAALAAKSPLGPFEIERRAPGPTDVEIRVAYCGICHSDLHQARAEWGAAIFPMVPGHEIVGHVTRVGAQVKHFKPGDIAGVGCMVNSCGNCEPCRDHLEQFCEPGAVFTYNGYEKDGRTPTYGGYSQSMVVDEGFVLKVSPKLDLAGAAPLLCAGITTYSPLKHWKVGPGQRVGIVGLGGLGHMGVKFARALGAETYVFTTTAKKAEDAHRLGAHEVVLSTDKAAMDAQTGRFDLILDTVSADHDLNQYLGLLRREGTLVQVGAPERPQPVSAFSLIFGRKKLAGSLIGGIRETQEMLDFCAEKGIVSDVEVIPMQKVNEAYERLSKGDVKYRFSIDLRSLD